MMKRRLSIALLLSLWAGVAEAQDPKAVFVAGPVVNDVKGKFGLTQDKNSTQARAIANRVAIQAKLDANDTDPMSTTTAKLFQYPWFFQGAAAYSAAHTSNYAFDNTIVNPSNRGNASFIGPGVPISAGTSNLSAVRFVVNANESYARTVFDGTTNALTSSGAGAVVVVNATYRVVDDRLDVGNSVYISGGTGATAGWYGIASADEGANTWTLDSNWCSGAVTNGAGEYTPAIWRDHAKANRYQGLWFAGRYGLAAQTDPTAGVGLHLSTNQGSSGVSTGKHVIDSCFFDNFKVGVLIGRNLTGWQGTNGQYVGYNDNHADSNELRNCRFTRCESAVLVRNNQAVFQNLFAMWCDHCGTALDVEHGGKINVYGVHIQGPDSTFGIRRIVRIGPGVSSGESSVNVYGFSADATPPNLQLVKIDGEAMDESPGQVTISGGKINRAEEHTVPLVDISGSYTVTISGVTHGNSAFEENDLRLRQGAESDDVNYLILQGCDVAVADLEDLIDLTAVTGSEAGAVVDFRCIKSMVTGGDGNNITHPLDGRYIVGTGWVPFIRAGGEETAMFLRQHGDETLFANTKPQRFGRFGLYPAEWALAP